MNFNSHNLSYSFMIRFFFHLGPSPFFFGNFLGSSYRPTIRDLLFPKLSTKPILTWGWSWIWGWSVSCVNLQLLLQIWSNYSDLTRVFTPKLWFSKGIPLISGKSRFADVSEGRLVKYYNLARQWKRFIAVLFTNLRFCFFPLDPGAIRSHGCKQVLLFCWGNVWWDSFQDWLFSKTNKS